MLHVKIHYVGYATYFYLTRGRTDHYHNGSNRRTDRKKTCMSHLNEDAHSPQNTFSPGGRELCTVTLLLTFDFAV